MPPTSLYIHMPWCIQKCPYCDFNSHKSPGHLPEDDYIDALIADLQQDLATYGTRTLCSIFIGGGTPSLFSATAYERLFTAIQSHFHYPSDLEITLEANPGTVEQQRFADYRALGINRLSLGIQSFHPQHLKALGRIHTDQDAHRAITLAQRYFDRVNLDIMHGLPHQTIAEGIQDLSTALTYQPTHLSWYQLTLEPNTPFYKHPPLLPSDETADELEQAGFALLHAHHYEHYEISAFCQAGFPARHNLNYWQFGDYYGIGAGAHGKHTQAGHIYRTRKYRQPKDYLNPTKSFLAETTCLSLQDIPLEFMLNATRLAAPVAHTLFEAQTGHPAHLLAPGLTRAIEQGLITSTDTHWQVTPFGRRFTNDLQALFMT